eukprot:gene10180-biopygen10804
MRPAKEHAPAAGLAPAPGTHTLDRTGHVTVPCRHEPDLPAKRVCRECIAMASSFCRTLSAAELWRHRRLVRSGAVVRGGVCAGAARGSRGVVRRVGGAGGVGVRCGPRAQGDGGVCGGGSVSHFPLQAEQSSTGVSSSAPRCEPPRARAPGAQMIRMGSGSSPAFQQPSRPTCSAGSAFRLA